MYSFKAELLKLKRAKIVWITFLAFAMAPIFGAVFMLIVSDPEALEKAGAFSAKAQMFDFKADWYSYLNILIQAMGIGGLILFGFAVSWIFGREYSDDTVKDLLALPIGRARILNAKFAVYLIWSFALAISNVVIAAIIGTIMQIEGFQIEFISELLPKYIYTTLLTIALGTPVALAAIWGRGYLAPLGFVILAVVFAQIIAATGNGHLFPWAVPGLYGGAVGDYGELLTVWSYVILLAVSVIAYFATILYWKYADHKK